MTGAEGDPPPPPCPSWCTGRHDQTPWHGVPFHESPPMVPDVLTGLVKVQCVTAMTQYPKDPDPASRHVFAWSHVSASVRMRQPSDVHAFADMLVGYAGRLREVAEELATAQRADLAARSERT
jgi:hypothetical protein